MSHGRIDAATRPFCNEVPDSIEHLFFGCHVTSSIAFFWASRCNLPWINRTWEETLSWASIALSGREFFKCLACYSFGALCHIIWKNRNNILFRGELISISAMKNHLIRVVKDKAITYKNVEDSTRNRRMQRSWDLDPIIFFSPNPRPLG